MLIAKSGTAHANSNIFANFCRHVLALYTHTEHGDIVSILSGGVDQKDTIPRGSASWVRDNHAPVL